MAKGKRNEEDMPLPDMLGSLMQRETLCKYTPTVHVRGDITTDSAKTICDSIKELKYARGSEVGILEIASPGGDVHALFEILSAMRGSEMKWMTYCPSYAYSAGAVLLSAGTPGMRVASPFASIMVHPMLTAMPSLEGIEDVVAETKHLEKCNESLLDVLAANCKLSPSKFRQKLNKNTSRNFWLDANEALEFNLIDIIGVPTVHTVESYNISVIED